MYSLRLKSTQEFLKLSCDIIDQGYDDIVSYDLSPYHDEQIWVSISKGAADRIAAQEQITPLRGSSFYEPYFIEQYIGDIEVVQLQEQA